MERHDAKRAALLEGPILRSLLTLAVPIIAGNLLQTGYQLTDAFWVGRLGVDAVAAVSVSFPMMFLLIALGTGFAVAGSTLVAQYYGAKNHAMVNHVAAQTLLLVIALSVFLGTLGYLFAPTMLRAMGVEPVVFDAAVGFLRAGFIGLPFVFGFAMVQSLMRGIGVVTTPLWIVLGTVLLNAVLDPLFIYGWGPIPATGVMGAAVATVGTQSIAFFLGIGFLLGGKYGIHLRISDFRPERAFIHRAFRLGLPASVEQSARALGFMAMTFLVAHFGTLATAAYGVGSNILQFVLIPSLGLSIALATLVGQHIGAKKLERAIEIARLGARVSFLGLTAIGGLIILGAEPLVRFFIPHDPAVVAEAVVFVRTMAWTFGFFGLQMAFAGVFRAAGDMIAAMLLALLAQWAIQFPVAAILANATELGIRGVWWAFPVSNVVVGLVALAWFRTERWHRRSLTDEGRAVERASEEIIAEEGIR